MQWAFRIRRKISAALLLAAIFVLVFVKNIVEEKYVTELGNSFASVYEDRLVVESYIYKLSDNLLRKKIMIDTCSAPSQAKRIKPLIDGHNASINTLIADYERTRLTDAESKLFGELKENIRKIDEDENSFFRRIEDGEGVSGIKASIDTHFNQASQNLTQLSAIQLSEGKLLNDHSRKIVAGSSLLTQFELGILIAISLMILVLVFESTTALTHAEGRSLN